jgi:hypothetical protein
MRIPGHTKRQKELARAQQRRDKDAKREQRRKEKVERASQTTASTEDPDLAGIVPGPQPPTS